MRKTATSDDDAMEVDITKRLGELGLDPIVPLLLCAQALGASTQTLKNLAKRGELEIIRVSERRCGIRRSVLDRFLASRQSAVASITSPTPRSVLGKMVGAKRGKELADA